MIKQTSKGEAIIAPRSTVSVMVTLNGQPLGGLGIVAKLPAGKATEQAYAAIWTTPKIGLSRTEYDQLLREMATTPKAEPIAATYEELVARWQDLAQDYSRAIEAASQGKPMDYTIGTKAEMARQAIMAYKAAHPEEMAKRKTDKDAMIARTMWD